MMMTTTMMMVLVEKEEEGQDCRLYRTLPIHSASQPWKQHLR